MSYCVHCGVQLADAESACPLCGTPVMDPSRGEGAGAEPMFVERWEAKAGRKVNWRFVVNLVFCVLAAPFVVTLIVGLCVPADLGWTVYVLAALLVLWIVVVLPLIVRLKKPYVYLLIDAGATLALLAIVAAFTHGWRWFLILGLPLTALALGVALMMTFVIRRSRLNALAKVGWCFIIVAVEVMLVGIVVGLFRGTSVLPLWGWVSALPCAVLGLVMVLLGTSVRASEWLRKNLFI